MMMLLSMIGGGGTASDEPTNRTYALSEYGAVSDALVAQGSSTYGTDNTAAIDAVMALCDGVTPTEIIVDGQYSTTGGHKLKSNVTLRALNDSCGFILRPNSNRYIFQNQNKVFRSTIIDQNIALIGGVYNGNAGNQPQHDNADGWVCALRFYGIRNLNMQGVTIYDPRTFSVHIVNWENIVITDLHIDVGAETINKDGLHFNGPGNFARITNSWIKAYDDHIAFNADDAFSGGDTQVDKNYYNLAFGDITDVVVDGLTLGGGWFGVRLLSGASRMDNIHLKNIAGTTKGYAILIDNYWQNSGVVISQGTGNTGSVTVDNVNVVVNDFTQFPINKAVISLTNNIESIVMTNVTPSANTIPTLYKGSGYTYGTVTLNGTPV